MHIPEGLVERAVHGDRAALASLVDAVQQDVWRLMLSRLGNTADAEDATQETLRQAVASIGELRDPRAFAGWLYRIALDKARETRSVRASQERTAAALAARASVIGDGEMNRVETAELREQVRAAVKGLDRDLRETVELRYDHDLSYEEIAEAMDVPAGTVGRRLHTAHERLQRALAAAGVAIVLAALERELAAAPRTAMPPEVARRVTGRALQGRAAKDGAAGGVGTGRTIGRPVAFAVGLAVLLGVAVPVGVWMRSRAAAQTPRPDLADSRGVAAASDRPETSGGQESAGNPPGETASDPAGKGVCRLEGRVLAAEGDGVVPGAHVRLIATLHDRPVVAAETRADAEGAWALEAREGTYALRVEAPGYVALEFEREYRRFTRAGRADASDPTSGSVTLAAGKTVRRDVVLASTLATAVRLSGIVLDDRAFPVADARVRIVSQSEICGRDGAGAETSLHWPFGESSGSTVTTDLQGTFEFPSVFGSGEVTLEASRDGLAPARLTTALRGADARVTIVLSRPAAGRGVVVDERGAPVPDAVVLIGVPAGENSPPLRKLAPRTDAVGAFSIEEAAADSVVVAFAPGHGWTIRRLSTTEAFRIELPGAASSLRGHVRDEAGRPVAGITVRITGYRGRAGDLAGNLAFPDKGGWGGLSSAGEYRGELPENLRPAPVKTAEDGSFEIPGQPLGNGLRVSFSVERNGKPLMTMSADSDTWLDIVVK